MFTTKKEIISREFLRENENILWKEKISERIVKVTIEWQETIMK
jgi:hypothetical protein